MPQENTIIIKFKPQGDKKLIAAIEKLSAAQKKLQGAVVDTEKKTSGLIRNQDRLGKTNKMLALSFATLRSKMLLFSFAMSMGVRQLLKFSQQAAKVESMSRAFNTLSGGVEHGASAMSLLRKATDGTMSQFDLFQQANNALILGVSKNSAEMAEMFDIAQRLGRALGRDTASSVESLITGIGRQSRLMLDNIGIIVKADEAYENYAENLGVTADKLTDAQKKTAFLEATMESARKKVKALGDETLTAQDSFDKFTSSTEDLTAEIGRRLSPLVETMADLMTFQAEVYKLVKKATTELSSDTIKFSNDIDGLRARMLSLQFKERFNLPFDKKELDAIKTRLQVIRLTSSDINSSLGNFNFPLTEEDANNIKTFMDAFNIISPKLTETLTEQEAFTKAVRDNADALAEHSALLKEEESQINKVNANNAEWADELNKIEKEINAVIKAEGEMILVENEHGNLVSKMPDQLKKLREEQKEVTAAARADAEIGREIIEVSKSKISNIQEEVDKQNQLKESLREVANINKLMAEFESPKTFAEQAEAIINENEINALLLTEEEKQKIRDHFRELEKEANVNAIQEGLDIGLSSINSMLSAQQNKLDMEMSLMKQSEEFQNASSQRREMMETAMRKKQASERTKIAEKEKLASVAQASMSVYESIVAALGAKPYGPWNIALATAVGAMGFAQVSSIASTPIPKFASGGMVGGRRHSQGGTMIEAEQGEFVMSRDAVDSVGLENLNRMNQGGSSAVNVNISGNVMSQDFVEGQLADSIRDAVRRGTDFGIN